MNWISLLSILLFTFSDVSVSDDPVHPTSTTDTTEIYLAPSSESYKDKTIICNYYNTGSPKNCLITCQHKESCFMTNINCNNAPNCDIECSPSLNGCASAKINTGSSNTFNLHCNTVPLWPLQPDSLYIPCHAIQVYNGDAYDSKPITTKSITSSTRTAKIDCSGMAACYRGSFDVSNYDLSDISCHTNNYVPWFGTSCALTQMYGNQNTKIICHGGQACTLTNITLTEYGNNYLRIGDNETDNYNIECLGGAWNDTWTCAQMVVDARNISNFNLNCAANKGCANTQIIVSPLKKNNNKIRCIPGSYPLIGRPRSCEWMTIWTDVQYELGFLNITCEGDLECAGLEMWCFDSNLDKIRFEYIDYWTRNDEHLYDTYGNNYDLIYYQQYDNEYYNDNYLNYSMNNYNKKDYRDKGWSQCPTNCQPLSDGVLFNEWPLLQIIDSPSYTYINPDDHTRHAVFYGADVFEMQFAQINCTDSLQYESCDILCDSYFSCQGAYIAVHDKSYGNITCKNRGCFSAAINVENITQNVVTQCEESWSCFFAIFDLYNIDYPKSVDINCGSIISDDTSQWAMCAFTIIHAESMHSNLNINCNNGTANCYALSGYGPNGYDTNINCNLAEQPCLNNYIILNNAIDINIDCSSYNGCQESQFQIGGITKGNFIMNCLSNGACRDVEVVLNGLFVGGNTMQTINCQSQSACFGAIISGNNDDSNTFINCYGEESCTFININILDYTASHKNDDKLSLNCNGQNSCSLFKLLSTKSLINITCNGNSACNSNFILSERSVEELYVLCNGSYSCQYMHIQPEYMWNNNESMILSSNISTRCNGFRSCYHSILNGNNLNISCNDTESCQLILVNVSNTSYLNMKCGDLSITNNNICSQSNLYISGLSKHSNIKCGDCSSMTINVPYHYSPKNDFMSMSCITDHKNCDKVNRTGFEMYCYNDSMYASPNDKRINCQNGYQWPFISEPKPDFNNETGVYFIANPNNSYIFEYSNISCTQYNKSCFVHCNGNYSCCYSLIQYIGINNLTINCGGTGGCFASNILFNTSSSSSSLNFDEIHKSNFNLNCDGISSCSSINVKYNGSRTNNIESNSNILFSNKSSNMNFSIFNNENMLFKVYNIKLKQNRNGLHGTFLLYDILMRIENIGKLDIESNINLSISDYHIFGDNVEYLIINSTEYNSVNGLYVELIETDMIEINCTNSYSCNALNINVSNDADIEILCGEYHETIINTSSSSSLSSSVEMLDSSCIDIVVTAPNANSMDIIFGAKNMLRNSIYGPSYYDDNGTIIVQSNIYCIDFGCNDLELISLNGLEDWNITLNGECQCDSIHECIDEWNIQCGQNLNYTDQWNGDNDQCTTSNNDEPICCPKQTMDELINSFNIYLNAVCPHNDNKKKSLSTIQIILIIAGGSILIIILLITLSIFICKRKRKRDATLNVGYSQIEK